MGQGRVIALVVVSGATLFQASPATAQMSPREFYRQEIGKAKKQEAEKQIKFVSEFWASASKHLADRSAAINATPPSDVHWLLSEQKDSLTNTRILKATHDFTSENAKISAEFICNEATKQLTVSLYDRTPSVRELNLPPNAQHTAEVFIAFDPSPDGIIADKPLRTIMRFYAQKMKLTGFNDNNWGESICGPDAGGNGYVFNSVYCTTERFPESSRPAGYKSEDWVRYGWLDFEEVRLSIRTVWGNPNAGSTIPTTYLVKIKPRDAGLVNVLNSCRRNENVCLSISDESAASACNTNFIRSISN